MGQLVTRGDVVILDKSKYLESLEYLLAAGGQISDEDWTNMGAFVKSDGTDLYHVGENSQRLSSARLDAIFDVLTIYIGNQEKNIRETLSSYLVQFRKEEFFDGLT